MGFQTQDLGSVLSRRKYCFVSRCNLDDEVLNSLHSRVILPTHGQLVGLSEQWLELGLSNLRDPHIK